MKKEKIELLKEEPTNLQLAATHLGYSWRDEIRVSDAYFICMVAKLNLIRLLWLT
jgi:hypothetical protein